MKEKAQADFGTVGGLKFYQQQENKRLAKLRNGRTGLDVHLQGRRSGLSRLAHIPAWLRPLCTIASRVAAKPSIDTGSVYLRSAAKKPRRRRRAAAKVCLSSRLPASCRISPSFSLSNLHPEA